MRGEGPKPISLSILFTSVSGQKEIPTPSPFLRRGSAGLVQLMEVPITKFPDMIHVNDEEGGDGGES